MRVEHEYERGGALAYLAAWDVHQARLFGRCEPSTGIEPFGRLVEQVMTAEPYASARRVFWVVDNGSSHRGQASVDRLQGAWSNLTLIHLPVHASWLNQIEIYFSIVQRKVLTPNDFLDLVEVQRRLVGFQRRYEQTAVPFDWRFTRADLQDLLRRLDISTRSTTVPRQAVPARPRIASTSASMSMRSGRTTSALAARRSSTLLRPDATAITVAPPMWAASTSLGVSPIRIVVVSSKVV
jgi:hypothetical protein